MLNATAGISEIDVFVTKRVLARARTHTHVHMCIRIGELPFSTYAHNRSSRPFSTGAPSRTVCHRDNVNVDGVIVCASTSELEAKFTSRSTY